MMNFEPLGGADEQNVVAFEQQIGFTLPKGGGNAYFVADNFTAFCQALRDYNPFGA